MSGRRWLRRRGGRGRSGRRPIAGTGPFDHRFLEEWKERREALSHLLFSSSLAFLWTQVEGFILVLERVLVLEQGPLGPGRKRDRWRSQGFLMACSYPFVLELDFAINVVDIFVPVGNAVDI